MATPMRTGTADGPTNETGYSSALPINWSIWVNDQQENATELRWPMSVRTYHMMRTDAQIDGLLKAITLPIRRSRWVIDPNGARDEVVETIASDMHLPILGVDNPPMRSRRRFSHDEFQRHALLALVYGFMFFEQVGDIESDLWRLQKLAPRLPTSIKDITVDEHGELKSITQWPMPGTTPWQGKPIPVDVLAPYVWDREGANWTGRSMLRACYRDWLIKDRLIRVDAIKNERFGMGIPYASAPAGASKETIERYAAMARAVRADASSGVGLPEKGDIGIEGIRGTLPDILGSLEYHDAQMTRSFLAMFIMLGQTKSGSRALGESFVDFFKLGIDAVCDWYTEIGNAYVIEDMVDWNWGPEENAPLLKRDVDEESRMDAKDLVALIEAGVVVVDQELRDWITDRWGISQPGPGTPAPPGPSPTLVGVPEPVPAPAAAPAAAGAGRRPLVGTQASGAEARSQTLHTAHTGHRDPTSVELASRTDFTRLQQEWTDQTTKLVNAWQTIRTQQIDELVDKIRAAVDAGSVQDIATVSADTLGGDLIMQHMTSMLESAVQGAKDEAAAQGITLQTMDLTDLVTRISAQADAVAALMNRGISNSAATQALQRYGASSLTGDEVAAGVRDHLESLSDSWLNDMLGGALTQAQNAGRMEVMGQVAGTYYSSELLDENTCEECATIDGTQYDTIGDAEQDYPTGGYSECLGGPRCRGTVVAVYDEAQTAT